MQSTPLTLAARVASEPDPARRFHAARVAAEVAAEAAAAPFDHVANNAVEELIAAHHGVVAAAARELGLTAQALHKRRKKQSEGGPARPAGHGTEQIQPALRFCDATTAEDALRDWQLRMEEITDQRDPYLLGALAAGVDPVTISDLTDIGLDTLRRIRPSGNITVSQLDEYGPEIEEFARAVTDHAKNLAATCTSPAERAASRIWDMEARAIVSNAAPYALDPEPAARPQDFETAEEYIEALRPAEDAGDADRYQQSALAAVSGPDAWLAYTYVQLRRQADKPFVWASDENDERKAAASRAVNDAFRELADAILHLRTTGRVPANLSQGAS